jgi:pSer/pThr/pTyr-binding forkhead associated (FHA) protein
MIICPVCQSKQLDGTIFCAECGGSLIENIVIESTRNLDAHDPLQSGHAVLEGVERAPDPAAHAGPHLNLFIFASRRRIRIDLEEEVLIGRADRAKGIIPDIDLGPDGGYDAGVSRRHAILAHRNGDYVVEDLGSSNGTFVNGRQIAPQDVVRLANGDELQCGTLRMRIEFG